MTVFFSDIRNFTNISEQLESTELVSLINEVLTPITNVIHHNQGTIDKYIGDAVMAFWGAPRVTENHATQAVKSALGVVEALATAQDEYREHKWPEIRIGVGLATGYMTVGNMGSAFRLSYTVMGDTVNLGSRLEGLTKNYGVDIIVTEATRDAAPDFLYRKLDLVRVKGKEEAIAIFEPIAELQAASESQRLEVERVEVALSAYRDQRWMEARELFTSLQEENPDSFLYQLYLDRIEQCELEPPPEDWDGVFIFTSK
jgi:adenylate cyclase